MAKGMTLVGLDVHARQTHAAVLDPGSGEVGVSRLRMPPIEVVSFLDGLGPGVVAVYEAGPTGFGLARAGRERGIDVRVVAPGSIPKGSGDRVKTDRRDAVRMVRLLAAGELSFAFVLSGAGLCAETGDWRRFAKPDLVAGFLGIVPSERTSDTKRRHGSITKAGPGHARRLLVEAAQHYRSQPRVGAALARRQIGQDPRAIAIAWRAQRRLHQRWQHLHQQRRKPAGVVAIAVARELAGFLWEAATLDA